jgi:hypothetical protein
VVGCIEPLAAITETVDVVAEIGITSTVPQPVHRLSPTAKQASSSRCMPRRFFQPKQQTAIAITEPGNNGLGSRWRAAVIGAVVTVSIVEVAPPEGIKVAGEKLHDAPAGNPEQLNEMAESNPLFGVTKTVVVPLCPAVTETDAGKRSTEKLGVDACTRLTV